MPANAGSPIQLPIPFERSIPCPIPTSLPQPWAPLTRKTITPRQITERDIPSFAEAIEGTMVELKDGQLITGIVVKIDRDGVLLDVGYKTEGVIPTRELAPHK